MIAFITIILAGFFTGVFFSKHWEKSNLPKKEKSSYIYISDLILPGKTTDFILEINEEIFKLLIDIRNNPKKYRVDLRSSDIYSTEHRISYKFYQDQLVITSDISKCVMLNPIENKILCGIRDELAQMWLEIEQENLNLFENKIKISDYEERKNVSLIETTLEQKWA
jgi:hypothetical protein